MDDEANVQVDADRPKVGIFGAIEFVEPHTGTRWIELQVKGCSFNDFLLLAGQLCQAISEGVSDAEFH